MFLIIENDPHCPAGGLAELIAAAGETCRCLPAYLGEALPSPVGATGVVVLGGEMGVHDTASFPFLATVRTFMKDALEADVPLLGICLGGQLLAQVAGGTVASPSLHGELGICSVELNAAGAADPLFRGVPSPFTTFQLHNDSFTVPPGAALLASSNVCPSQTFRLGKACYGVQFHPEVDRAIVSLWGDSLQPPRDLLAGFLAAESAFNAASHTLLANFIALAAAHSRP